MIPKSKTVVWFRRDLRAFDHAALHHALRDAVQAQLSAMAQDGSLAELAVHWFGANIAVVK